MDCIFCKVAKKEINSKILYEDDKVVVFDDLHPHAPSHKLIIPKKHISSLNELTPEDTELMGHIVLTAQRMARELGLTEGYRLVSNCGPHAGQSVFHIHFHLLGGRQLSWPPG